MGRRFGNGKRLVVLIGKEIVITVNNKIARIVGRIGNGRVGIGRNGIKRQYDNGGRAGITDFTRKNFLIERKEL